MTGMKEGAGEDPFAEDAVSPDQTAEEDSDKTSLSTAKETADEQSATQPQVQIPYKFRRESVQDGRDRVPLFLQPETKEAEHKALRELEERFGGNLSLTDLREALVKVGLAHLDETEENLEEWGYGMKFE